MTFMQRNPEMNSEDGDDNREHISQASKEMSPNPKKSFTSGNVYLSSAQNVESGHWRKTPGGFAQLPAIISQAIISSQGGTIDDGDEHTFQKGGATLLQQTPQRVCPHSFASQSSSGSEGTTPPNTREASTKDPRLRRYSQKYGPELTANFLDIKQHGSKAFFRTKDPIDGDKYSLCSCATGYIWARILPQLDGNSADPWISLEMQIGTYALSTMALTLSSIPFQYKMTYDDDIIDGKLSLLCTTVLAEYFRLRVAGLQFEDAAEKAVKEARKELSAFRVVDPGKYIDFQGLLLEICRSAHAPPVSSVSEISRGMILKPWRPWSDGFHTGGWTWWKKASTVLSQRKDDPIEVMGKVVGNRT